jgi:hypothetical protein
MSTVTELDGDAQPQIRSDRMIKKEDKIAGEGVLILPPWNITKTRPQLRKGFWFRRGESVTLKRGQDLLSDNSKPSEKIQPGL